MTLSWQIHLPISLPARLIKYIKGFLKGKYMLGLPLLAPVVQTSDSAIHRINLYPVDSVIDFPNTYPLDSDLSGG